MNYQSFYQQFRPRLIISLDEIRKYEPDFLKLNIINWTKKWYIKPIVKWRYIFADVHVQEDILCYIANKIYEPSYISLEMALSYYHLIPEGVFTVTSISSKKTQKFDTIFGTLVYHSIKNELMFGYTLKKIDNLTYKIADIEKAVLDFFYFKPYLSTAKDFEDLRFDCYEFLQQANLKKFAKYLQQYPSQKFKKQMTDFISYVQQNA